MVFINGSSVYEERPRQGEGQVVLQYLQKRGKSQVWLAEQLQLTKMSVSYLLHRECLDSMRQCRLLVRLLDIPPVLLGLDADHSPIERFPHWWKEMYPEIDADEEGYPQIGQVIRLLRERMSKEDTRTGRVCHWTQADLGQALEKDQRTILNMENTGIGTDLKSRRQALLTIFGAGAAALLGLASPPPLVPPPMPLVPDHFKIESLVLLEYQAEQDTFWTEYYTQHGEDSMQRAFRQLAFLESVAPYASRTQLRQLATLRSRNHGLITNVGREQRDYQLVFPHAYHAVALALSVDDDELLATALLRRALAWFNYGNIQQAKVDIDGSLRYARHARQQIYGHVLVDVGMIHAHAAQDNEDRVRALRSLEQAHAIAQTGYDDGPDPHHMNFDLGLFHISNTMALLALGETSAVADELRYARRTVRASMRRRQAILDVLHAQYALARGEYDEACALALEALEKCERVRSRLNRDRVAEVYTALRGTKYAQEPLLAQLGVKLLRW